MHRGYRSYLVLVFALLFPSVVFAGDWPSLHQNYFNHNLDFNQPVTPFTTKGSFTSQYSSPVIQGNIAITAYSTGSERRIIAYRVSDVTKLWEFSIGTSFPKQITIDRGSVYFGLSSKGTVYALDLLTGKLQWQKALPSETGIRFAPILIEENLFIPGNNSLHKLSRDGTIVWSKLNNIRSPLATDGEKIYFRIHNQRIIRISPETGAEEWSYLTGTTNGTQPVVTDTTVFVGTYQKIVGIDKQTGIKRFEYPTPMPIIGSVGAVGDRFVFGTNFGDITALSENGTKLWTNRVNSSGFGGAGWQPQFTIAGDAILARSGANEHTFISALDGSQIFNGKLPVDSAEIRAIAGDYIFATFNDITTIFEAASWTPGTLGPPVTTKRIDPVVIIPGILESWPINKVWKIDPFLRIFDGLFESLREVGYVDEQTLFPFPYDWHVSNEITGRLLKDKIAEIRQSTGAKKVDIVAHSMGGLVARSYIQSNDYANDVDELITIGTPHKGSVKAYLTWEAGETGDSAIDTIKEKFILYESSKNGYGSNVVKYISEKMVSVKELLPTFSYLKIDQQFISHSPCLETLMPCNTFLEMMNNNSGELPKRVRLVTINGKGSDDTTLKELSVLADQTWQHGKPINYPKLDGLTFDKGDGTVLYTSARIDGAEENIFDSNHTKIVTDSAKNIAKQLSNKTAKPKTYTEPKRFLTIFLLSPIDMLVTDSRGNRVGTDFSTGQLINEWSNAHYSGNLTDQEYAFITDPLPGTYYVTVTGTDDGDYTIQTSFIDDDQTVDSPVSGTIKKGETIQYKLTVTNTGSAFEKVVSPEPAVPTITLSPSPQISTTPLPSPTIATVAVASPIPSPRITIQITPTPMPSAAPTEEPHVGTELDTLENELITIEPTTEVLIATSVDATPESTITVTNLPTPSPTVKGSTAPESSITEIVLEGVALGLLVLIGMIGIDFIIKRQKGVV